MSLFSGNICSSKLIARSSRNFLQPAGIIPIFMLVFRRSRTPRRSLPFQRQILSLSLSLSLSISTDETVEYVFGRLNLHLHFLSNLNCPRHFVSSLGDGKADWGSIIWIPRFHIFSKTDYITCKRCKQRKYTHLYSEFWLHLPPIDLKSSDFPLQEWLPLRIFPRLQSCRPCRAAPPRASLVPSSRMRLRGRFTGFTTGMHLEFIIRADLKLGNVWVFVQPIQRPTRTKNQLYKTPNIA